MYTTVSTAPIVADTVTSWPREGVALLVAIVVVTLVATAVVNLRGRTGTAPAPHEPLDLLAPVTTNDENEDQDLPSHDI